MFYRLFVSGHFPLLAERARFALDPLKAEKCPIYVKIKVDLK